MTGRKAGLSAVVLTVLAVGLMLLLMMFAARAGPQRIVDGTLVDPHMKQVDPPTASPLPLDTLHKKHRGQETFHPGLLLTGVGWAVRIGIALFFAWLAYRGLRLLFEAVRDRDPPEPRPAQVDFDALEDSGPLVDQMRADAAHQSALLLDGIARDAIVACWDRFEVQAAQAGIARRPWETSSEFTLRLLDFVSADSGAVARLERLYHEARFSEHVIGEDRRSAAAEALQSIHATLPTRTRIGL